MPVEGGQEQQDSTKGRCLRRTVSVPSEGQFPEYPPEGAAKLGKLIKGKPFLAFIWQFMDLLLSATVKQNILHLQLRKLIEI